LQYRPNIQVVSEPGRYFRSLRTTMTISRDSHRSDLPTNGGGSIRDLRLPIGSGRAESESSRRGEAFRSACKSPALRAETSAPFRYPLVRRDQLPSLRGSGVSQPLQ